jgi:hypothetical protein
MERKIKGCHEEERKVLKDGETGGFLPIDP